MYRQLIANKVLTQIACLLASSLTGQHKSAGRLDLFTHIIDASLHTVFVNDTFIMLNTLLYVSDLTYSI